MIPQWLVDSGKEAQEYRKMSFSAVIDYELFVARSLGGQTAVGRALVRRWAR